MHGQTIQERVQDSGVRVQEHAAASEEAQLLEMLEQVRRLKAVVNRVRERMGVERERTVTR